MPELVFFRRGEEVLRVGMDRPRLVLGRGEQSDVVIPDPEVSRQQVALVLDGGRCQPVSLRGRGSKNTQSSGQANGIVWATSSRQRSTVSPVGRDRLE